MQRLELLAPARNADIGIEAINHGADAVYIGGPQFGARAAAGNSLSDIKRLCKHAHTYGAKVYVTLNTIIYDHELKSVEDLVHQLYKIGVDALIVQDLALTRMNLPPIELHASTQLDITTPEKALMLEQLDFKQIVLARELNLQQISAIHAACPRLPLEAFVHGALCVSYSGRCYASQHCFQRSANRGECAQFCRLPFEVIDADGKMVHPLCHPLSLRDMNRSAHLQLMIKAGVCSFKIEGRLKDATYVKNITALYSQALNDIIAQNPGKYQRSSAGLCTYTFTPQADKSFNRGFTPYFLQGKRGKEASIETPKSKGELIGSLRTINARGVSIQSLEGIQLHAGDGLCFIDLEGNLQGFRANTAMRNAATRCFDITFGPNAPQWSRKPLPANVIRKISVYRNADTEFEKQLAKPTGTRKLQLNFKLAISNDALMLTAKDELGRQASICVTNELTAAREAQTDNFIRQLMKLGQTPYYAGDIDIAPEVSSLFVPASQLTAARREIIDTLLENAVRLQRKSASSSNTQPQIDVSQLLPSTLDYTANVANEEAHRFFTQQGVEQIQPAYELQTPKENVPIMFCKYCLRHELGLRLKQRKAGAQLFKEPLRLRGTDGRTFRLKFDCAKCEMQVIPE